MSVQWWRQHTDNIVSFFFVFLLALCNNARHIIWALKRSGQWIHALYTRTHRHTSIKALSGQIPLPAYVGASYAVFILKSYSFIILFFFCKFCKNIKPSFNAKSEKELLPERCCVVHRALMSKWLSLRVTGLWSVVGSGFKEWRWTLEEPVNDHWHSMEQMNASRLLMVHIGAWCRRLCSPHLKKNTYWRIQINRIPVFVYAN